MGPIDTGEGPQGRVILNFSKPDFSKRGVDIRMWRARNGFTLLFPIIALCSSAAAQPGVAPEHRPAQGDSDVQRIADLVLASLILVHAVGLDSFGHMTVRSLKNTSRYFMQQ